MTEYVVLALLQNGEQPLGWSEIKTVQARSSQAALREVVADYSPPVPRWVAVPARSWRPVTVKTETKTQLTFS